MPLLIIYTGEKMVIARIARRAVNFDPGGLAFGPMHLSWGDGELLSFVQFVFVIIHMQ